MDMLSIRKIRLHGMKDKRWMTKDKIVQYKGLINLYKRDKKISNADKNLSGKKLKTVLANLKKSIGTSYEALENAIYGDKQKIRNVLAEDRAMKLAYQDLEPQVVMEHLHQQNFYCRKKLDLMQYVKLQKARRLVNVKLVTAEMEDRLRFDEPKSHPIEVQTSIYTALVQDANLKKEAAIVVNESYKKIISVMKKDQIYFDQILFNLRQDSKKQAECMLNTIVLGQLACEYLDDRREEFVLLEKAVKNDMHTRRKTVDTTREVVISLYKNIKFYIRRDSDINLPARFFSDTYPADLQEELSATCNILDTLKDTTLVNHYTKLVETFQEQIRQRDRLRNLGDLVLNGKDRLQNKMDHANMMHQEMTNTMLDSTMEYMESKRNMTEQIAESKLETDTAVLQKALLSKVINKIKLSLQQMEQMCKVMIDPKDRHHQVQLFHHHKPGGEHAGMRDIMDIKESGLDIIDILERKLLSILGYVQPIEEDDPACTQADNMMQKLIATRTISVLTEGPIAVESLLGDVSFEDPSIPTRNDIKTQSKEIVAMNLTILEEL